MSQTGHMWGKTREELDAEHRQFLAQRELRGQSPAQLAQRYARAIEFDSCPREVQSSEIDQDPPTHTLRFVAACLVVFWLPLIVWLALK